MAHLPTYVIKLGGEVISSGEAALLAADLHSLVASDPVLATTPRIAIVHGGGPQATALSARLGIPTHQVAGRRVTDAATLDVMKMVIAGKLNVDLCATLSAAGLRPVGLHTSVRAVRRPPKPYVSGGEPIDMGLVGDVTGFDLELLTTLWDAGRIPVVACLGTDDAGGVYNINADMVGNQLAASLKAERLFLVTSAPGVLRDIADPSSRIPTMTRAEATAVIASGVVSGGMVPKLEEAFSVIDQGVGAIHIIGKLGPGDFARAIREPGSIGTTLVSK